MYREHLTDSSSDQLAENCVRLQYAIEELQFLLKDLEEENLELQSTNEMLAATLLQLQSNEVTASQIQFFARNQVKDRARRQKSGAVQSEDSSEWAKIREDIGDFVGKNPTP